MHSRASLVLKAELNGSEWLLLVLWTFVLPDVGCGSLPIHLPAVPPGEMLPMAHPDLNSSTARNEFLFQSQDGLCNVACFLLKFPGSICSPTVARRSCSCMRSSSSQEERWTEKLLEEQNGILDVSILFITTAPVTTCWRYRWWPHVIYTVTQQLKMLTQPHAVSEGGIISLPCWHLWRGQHCVCIVQHHSDPNPQKVHQSYFQKAI